MSVLLVMFLWALSTVAIVWIFDFILTKMERLPEFFTNEEQGITALCSVLDFKSGLREKKITVVPETIIVAPYGVREGALIDYLSSNSIHQRYDLQKIKENRRLFIPFLSENTMTYVEQSEKFTSPQKLSDFIRLKKAEVISHDWRMRFAEKVSPYKPWLATGKWVSTATAVLILSVMGWVQLMADAEQREKEVIYSPKIPRA